MNHESPGDGAGFRSCATDVPGPRRLVIFLAYPAMNRWVSSCVPQGGTGSTPWTKSHQPALREVEADMLLPRLLELADWMKGQTTSASGAEDDSPPFQRWVAGTKASESLGDGTGFPFGRTCCAVPEALGSLTDAFPPLKRWAFLFRPAGRDSGHATNKAEGSGDERVTGTGARRRTLREEGGIDQLWRERRVAHNYDRKFRSNGLVGSSNALDILRAAICTNNHSERH